MSEVITRCPKCGVEGYLQVQDRGAQTALVCSNCRSWIKWVGKKQLPMYKRVLSESSISGDKMVKFENNLRNAIVSLGISKCDIIKLVDRIYS